MRQVSHNTSLLRVSCVFFKHQHISSESGMSTHFPFHEKVFTDVTVCVCSLPRKWVLLWFMTNYSSRPSGSRRSFITITWQKLKKRGWRTALSPSQFYALHLTLLESSRNRVEIKPRVETAALYRHSSLFYSYLCIANIMTWWPLVEIFQEKYKVDSSNTPAHIKHDATHFAQTIL